MPDVRQVLHDAAPGARTRGVRAPQDTEVQVSDVRTAVLQKTRSKAAPDEEGSCWELGGSNCGTDCRDRVSSQVTRSTKLGGMKFGAVTTDIRTHVFERSVVICRVPI